MAAVIWAHASDLSGWFGVLFHSKSGRLNWGASVICSSCLQPPPLPLLSPFHSTTFTQISSHMKIRLWIFRTFLVHFKWNACSESTKRYEKFTTNVRAIRSLHFHTGYIITITDHIGEKKASAELTHPSLGFCACSLHSKWWNSQIERDRNWRQMTGQVKTQAIRAKKQWATTEKLCKRIIKATFRHIRNSIIWIPSLRLVVRCARALVWVTADPSKWQMNSLRTLLVSVSLAFVHSHCAKQQKKNQNDWYQMCPICRTATRVHMHRKLNWEIEKLVKPFSIAAHLIA